ncbi:MAG: methylated-DNA--[protein]-cysteine S-methyltransferase [Gammaproteobacteria bacterium]|nr:methylated-DNA--[protein]-cysteine S-methyltransferase [Gammaproteobacteria bacterium]MCP5135613.1 methylated-DNA--[protein]-cysteine S-methyltransferase [Gammaproteobacteria bacterium]
MSRYSAIFDSPIGALGIRVHADRLIGIDFLGTHELTPPEDLFSKQVGSQLAQYFRDPRFVFELPFDERGTVFQKRVWQALRRIPCGAPISYGALATQLGTAARAIGGACRANPIPLLTPCHRVVAAQGIGGFSGDAEGGWVAAKQWLLAHERGERPASRVALARVGRG